MVDESTNGGTNERMVDESTNGGTNQRMVERINEWWNESTNERIETNTRMNWTIGGFDGKFADSK
jgi:hypothetical protein